VSAGLNNLKHIVVLMMEGRSFDHMLGFSMNPSWPIDGLNGCELNRDSTGGMAVVSRDARYSGDLTLDPGHSLIDTLSQLYSDPMTPVGQAPTMDGFVRSYEEKTRDPQAARRIMKCFSPEKLPVLTSLAQQFAICDRWFTSVPGPTFPNRAFAHAATSMGRVDMGVDWSQMPRTIYERLGEHGLTAKIYYHDSTMAMTFKNLMSRFEYFAPFDEFISCCKINDLPAYSFIEPRYANGATTNTFFSASDQHPDHNVDEGEVLIHRVFNAIWNNPAVRNETLLVIVYSYHGGLYDHVSPPTAVNPDGRNWAGSATSLDPPFDFTRLGVRVPAILVSPYIKAGTIDRTIYDHTSLIATVRNVFLPNRQDTFLTQRDKLANTFEGNLTLQKPRGVTPSFALSLSESPVPRRPTATELTQPASEYLKALVGQSAALEQQFLSLEERVGKNPKTVTTEEDASNFILSVDVKIRWKANQVRPKKGLMGRGGSTHSGSERPVTHAVMTLIGLVIGIGLLVFYVYKVPTLAENGAQNQIFYLLLIPWALSCAAFLFGAMKSYATYKSRQLPGSLQLGGPVVLFCLVLIGGFRLVPAAAGSFDLTVRAHSADGTVPLIMSGRVTVELENSLRSEDIGPNGEANFKGIPSRFQGLTVRILPQVSGYKQQWQRHKLQGNVLDLSLERVISPGETHGTTGKPEAQSGHHGAGDEISSKALRVHSLTE
jgi:phospholipase C